MGFTFAGVHSDQYGIKVLNITRPLSPRLQAQTVKRPGRAGVADMGVEVEELQISIDILLIGESLHEIRQRVRQIGAWLRNGEEKGTLVIDDEPDKMMTVRWVELAELEEVALTGRATLTFLAPDPLAYAVEDDAFTSAGKEIRFQRKGTAPSRPLIELGGEASGAESGFVIKLNDQSLTYTGSLASTEQLVLDSEYKTAYLRREDGSRESALNGLESLVFPLTRPGEENVLTVTPVGTATVNRLHIQCRSCWY